MTPLSDPNWLARPRRLAAALALAGLVAACSSTVAPHSRVYGPLDPSIPRLLYVTTNDERESVLAALRGAGFEITSDARETTLTLAVRLGNVRSKSSCGAIRNVVYELIQEGARLAVIKARGRTGSCQPNILAESSAELARLFGQGL